MTGLRILFVGNSFTYGRAPVVQYNNANVVDLTHDIPAHDVAEGAWVLGAAYRTFPAGTVTGAPKIRAMEIIDELEPVKRGIYGGACGYLSWAGDMDVAEAAECLVIAPEGTRSISSTIPPPKWRPCIASGCCRKDAAGASAPSRR